METEDVCNDLLKQLIYFKNCTQGWQKFKETIILFISSDNLNWYDHFWKEIKNNKGL